MIANPATAPMTIPAMAPPPNPLELDEGVGVGVPVVVPVLIGVEVPVRLGGVMLASSVDVESLAEGSADAVTVRIVAFVEHSSQESPPPARTSVAQICAVEGHVKHACPPEHPDCVKSKHFLAIVGITIVVE